ncbi:MAG: hypothetical protein KDK39_01470 [Leptospiraceae bacterium]|nr:hypothetical protein [Leptospiraceae bacterium]
MYKLCFYVPLDAAEAVKEAIFATGAGRIGRYDSCAWQTSGQGQFRALSGANPAVGQIGQIHQEAEWKVELVCQPGHVRAAVAALLDAHPYEEPAWQVWPCLQWDDLPLDET